MGLEAYSFACRRSGNCCARPGGRVRFPAEALEELAAFLGLELEGLLSLYLVPGPEGEFLAKEAPGGACPFLGSEGGLATCAIYPLRPAHCRSFPHREDVMENPQVLQAVLRFCPGLQPKDPQSS
ncbi:MAG TPA: YkgJ family cysteine cluster protein [Planctomycetes bacterium]|nr:YkgJ family cysteine cluster protein [Planctomycetota bacterium]